MTATVTQTRLSTQTINLIERWASLIAEDNTNLEAIIAEAMMKIGELAYSDGTIDTLQKDVDRDRAWMKSRLIDTQTEYGYVQISEEPITAEVL